MRAPAFWMHQGGVASLLLSPFAALYAAASDFSRNGDFRPAALEPHTWKQLSGRLRTYRAELPDKALSRGAYDAKRRPANLQRSKRP